MKTKTYLAHSISLSMVPLAIEDKPLDIFDWHFRAITTEEAFTCIREAGDAFENFTVLPMMDAILHGMAEDYGTVLQAPRGHRHMRLQDGDAMIVVRYSGRKLEPLDRTLPPGARLTFYKLEMRVAPERYSELNNTMVYM